MDFDMLWDLEKFGLGTQMVWNEYYRTIVSLVYWKFNMLWDFENFMSGTQMVCIYYYPNYIGSFIVFWDLENLA